MADEAKTEGSNSKFDWKVAVTIIGVLLGLLGLFGGSLWRTADVVFDRRAVEIPLSSSLRQYIERALAAAPGDSIAIRKNGQTVPSSPRLATLPDKLLYVDIRNVGHVPTATIRAQITVPGRIADKNIRDAGLAFGKVTDFNESDGSGELSFECQNLSSAPQVKITVAIWYEQVRSGTPSVDIEDTSSGVAREVPSIDAARFYRWDWFGSLWAIILFFFFLTTLTFFGLQLLFLLLKRRRD